MTKQSSDETLQRKRRGGRKPGEWKLLKDGDLRTWREKVHLSRKRLSELIEVSATSVQNWETGVAIPSMKFQRRIVDLMAQPASTLPVPARARSLFDRPSNDGSSAVEATGVIVGAYVAQRGEIKPEELVEIVRSIRAALS